VTNDAALLADLRQAAEPPAPKDFRPGVIYQGRMPSEITTEALPAMQTEAEWEEAVRAMGIHLPAGYGLVLDRAELAGSTNGAAWHRDPSDRGEAFTAYTAPNTTQRWRYRFKVVLKDPRADEDIAVLMKEARKAARGTPLRSSLGGSRVINLADLQTGKVDVLGGTPELLERSEVALAQVVAEIRRTKPKQIILTDPGDSTEGFDSAPNAARTNDLQITEQVRVWRRILWRWISTLSPLTEDLVVIGVPSNHCRVRSGKNVLGHALDDWGIEVISQVADIAKVNPEAYGHIRFIIPNEHEEHVLFTALDGQVIGVIHGHQANNANQLPAKIKANSRRGIGQADIVIAGHFHHLEVVAFGDGQWLFVCPTMDSGSSWFQYSGERSNPGVLSFSLDDRGWHSLHVAWA
jgi:hypothetical protein